jgi:ligand-binding sensor domain-containing protein
MRACHPTVATLFLRFASIVIAALIGATLLAPIMIGFRIVRAEQLPIRTYTTSEGLPADNVNRILRDSRGFLWFCTEEGLSRFDGYQFVNYTADQGLPDRRVTDLLEARDGTYWVATGGGVCLFNPTGVPRFRVYRPGNDSYSRREEALLEDRSGVIWCGTRNGLYRLKDRSSGSEFEFVQLALPNEGTDFVQVIIEDRQASLWIGTQLSGLYRRWPDGRVEHYTTRNGLSTNRIEALLEDSEGRIWAGTPDGLGLLVAAPDPSRPILARLYTTRDGLVTSWIESFVPVC